MRESVESLRDCKGSDPWEFFRNFRVFCPKKTGGFFDFRAVASRKLRKIMVIFARKMPPENSGKFPEIPEIPEIPGNSGKMPPKNFVKKHKKFFFFSR